MTVIQEKKEKEVLRTTSISYENFVCGIEQRGI